MYASKRLPLGPAIIVFILASFVLVACGVTGTNTSWPGLSTDGENVYVAYGPGVLAYDAESGQQVWSYPPEANSALSFFAAPSVQEGRVILGDYGATSGPFSPKLNVTLYALAADGGRLVELWTKSGLATGSIVAPPLQVGDQVFVGTGDNFIWAIDANSGDPLWPEPFATEHSIWGKPAYRDGTLYVASLDMSIYAIDADSGQERWRHIVDGALASAPIMNESLLYVTSFDNQLHALNIDTGEEAWSVAAEDWIWGSPSYDQGVVYFADVKGNIYAVDALSGAPRWSHQLDHPIQTSPVVHEEMVYIASEGDLEQDQGLLTALSAEDGQQLWQISTVGPLHTTPVIVDGSIIVAPQSESEASALLLAFDSMTGSPRWEVMPPDSQ